MKKWCLLLLLAILILPHNVKSIGLSPDSSYLKFESLKEGEISIRIINTEDRQLNASLRLEGETSKYFNIKTKSVLVPPLDSKQILIGYTLPYNNENPGPNQIIVSVVENIPHSQGMSARVNVISKIILDMPYPHKYIEYSFKINNINLEENMTLNFNIKNKGEENIFTVKPTIKFYSEENKNDVIKSYEYKAFAMNKDTEKNIHMEIPGMDIGPGNFIAETVIAYDGLNTKIISQNFTVGYKDIEILNVTKQILSGGIREFEVTLLNKWNNYMPEVYVVAHLEKDGAPITEKSYSQTIGLSALEKVEMPVFINIGDLIPGEYNSVLEVYYDNETKIEKFDLKVIKGLEISTGMIIAIIIVILIILDIGWMIFERKNIKPHDSSENRMKKLSGK